MRVECTRERRLLLSIPADNDMIHASAVVDVIEPPPPHGKGLGKFKVEVWGKEPHDYVRVYEIFASNDDAAAREGLDRFVEDVSAILSEGQPS